MTTQLQLINIIIIIIIKVQNSSNVNSVAHILTTAIEIINSQHILSYIIYIREKLCISFTEIRQGVMDFHRY